MKDQIQDSGAKAGIQTQLSNSKKVSKKAFKKFSRRTSNKASRGVFKKEEAGPKSGQEKIPNSESLQKMFIRRSFDTIQDVNSKCLEAFKDITSLFKTPSGIMYIMLLIIMGSVGVSKAATIHG